MKGIQINIGEITINMDLVGDLASTVSKAMVALYAGVDARMGHFTPSQELAALRDAEPPKASDPYITIPAGTVTLFSEDYTMFAYNDLLDATSTDDWRSAGLNWKISGEFCEESDRIKTELIKSRNTMMQNRNSPMIRNKKAD